MHHSVMIFKVPLTQFFLLSISNLGMLSSGLVKTKLNLIKTVTFYGGLNQPKWRYLLACFCGGKGAGASMFCDVTQGSRAHACRIHNTF